MSCLRYDAQVRLEQAQWQQVKTLLQPWLAARDLTASQLDTALCLVRSRTFAGPTFRVPVNVKLGLGAIAPVAILGSWLGSGGVAVSVEAAVGAAAALAAAAAVAAWDLQNASKQVCMSCLGACVHGSFRHVGQCIVAHAWRCFSCHGAGTRHDSWFHKPEASRKVC